MLRGVRGSAATFSLLGLGNPKSEQQSLLSLFLPKGI